jgi:hypothetical protein
VSTLARGPTDTGCGAAALEWLESPEAAAATRDAFAGAAAPAVQDSSAEAVGERLGGGWPVVVAVTASVAPEGVALGLTAAHASGEGVRFLRACSSVPLCHSAGEKSQHLRT